MNGVSTDLPVSAFVGHEFNQVTLGRFQVQLHASGTGGIFIEGPWELRDADGALIDQSMEHASRAAYRLHRLIDVPVERAAIEPPRSFRLEFHNGLSLTVFDTPQFESFSIHLDGRPAIFV